MPEDTEETEISLLFTKEDLLEEERCANCKYVAECLTIEFVNKLSVKKYGRGAELEMSCPAWKSDTVEDDTEDDFN